MFLSGIGQCIPILKVKVFQLDRKAKKNLCALLSFDVLCLSDTVNLVQLSSLQI